MSAVLGNPVGLDGIACVEFAAPDTAGLDALGRLFAALGFSRTKRHRTMDVERWRQGDVRFLVTRDSSSFAAEFARLHGPSIPAMGWWVSDAEQALEVAVQRGAKQVAGDLVFGGAPAVAGIGGSRIYFLEKGSCADEQIYVPSESPVVVPGRGFVGIDHLTNNVPKGTLAEWRAFYRDVFGFIDVRRFEIRGRSTGLTSFAMRSPCGKFCIPINEGSESGSQIEEYLREYRGPGIQHVALLTADLLESLDGLARDAVETLDIEQDYYRTVFERVPGVREDPRALERLSVLVDGNDEGYLLQVFTKNVIGPIFFELIQRRNHQSFGEGNFGALFRTIERDQERRGVL